LRKFRLSSLALLLLVLCFGKALLGQTNPLPGHAGQGLSPGVSPHLLTTVAQVHALSVTDAAKGLPVELHAIVTYYEPTEGQVFVQDPTGGVYIASPANPPVLKAGDAVVIRGYDQAQLFDQRHRPARCGLNTPRNSRSRSP
jgi:hypothetical protein